MVKKLFITLAVLFLVAGFARGGTIDPNTPDAKHIKYGADFHCVGRFCGLDKDGKLGVGSCVAIGERVVLTAAHVVHKVVSSHIHINDRQIDVLKIVVPDEFAHGEKLGGDIAICFLKSDIGLEFYPELYEKNDEIGRISSMAGFGIHGTFSTGGTKTDKHRRAGSNIIDKVIEDLLIVSPGGPRKTELEFCITPGDSGGGMFIDNKLAGINCCVFHDKGQDGPLGKYGHEAAHTRISKHRKWILDIVELHVSGFHGNEFIAGKEPDKDVKPICATTTLGDK